MSNYPFLKISTRKGRSGHRHLVYLRGEIGYTSTDKNHSHRVIRSIESGEWEVLPEDGHEHQLEDVDFENISVPNESETDIVRDCLALLRSAEDLERDFRENAEEADDMYYGDQWDHGDIGKLEGEDRPALTFNEIEPKIDLLLGYQTRSRTDIKYMPTENGDARVADLLTFLVKHITYQTKYPAEETCVCEDMYITGRGIFDVDIDYEKNIEGNIKISSAGWDGCYFGPHDKKDASDSEFVIKDKWLSIAKLKQLWPDKAEKISRKYWPPEIQTDSIQHTPAEAYENIELTESDLSPTVVNIQKKEFRVLEVWRKDYSRVLVAADPEYDVFISTDGWPKEEINKIKTIPVFTTVERLVTRSRITKIAGGVVLDDEYSDLFDGIFQVIPVYAKKRKKRVWGKVKPLIDPQREINKRRSQIADILNKVAAYGWFFDQETFPDEASRRKFKANSSRPGFVQEVNSTDNPPKQVEGVKFPAELAVYDESSSDRMNIISNVNLEMLGLNSNAQSGIAIAKRERQGVLGNEFLSDNLSMAKVQLGRIILKLIQKIFTPERILRIVQSQIAKNPNEPSMVGGQVFDQYNQEDLLKLLQTDDLSEYDVVVTESPYSDTARQAAFFMWAELAAQGLAVPPEYLADLSDAPNKEKLVEGIMRMQQMAAQAEQQKYQTELIKTIIAKKGDGGGDTGQPGPPAK